MALTLRIHIREEFSSNLDLDTAYREGSLPWLSSVPVGKFPDSTHVVLHRLLPNSFQFLFIIHPTIRRCVNTSYITF